MWRRVRGLKNTSAAHGHLLPEAVLLLIDSPLDEQRRVIDFGYRSQSLCMHSLISPQVSVSFSKTLLEDIRLKTLPNICLVVTLFASASVLFAQNFPTAIRKTRVQVGAEYSNANSDESIRRIGGISFYGTVDFYKDLGLEVDVHLLDFQTANDYAERTGLAGLRYSHPFGRFRPYIKGTGGIGQAVNQTSNVHLAAGHWGVYSIGGGLDYRLSRSINFRAIDVERQFWPNFPSNGLSPTVLSVGAAYRFH
jgi:hypothetical protein